MPEPWLSNFEALVSTRASEDATTMRLGAVGSGMPSKQQPVGSDASPSSGFRQSTNGTKGRKPTIDPRKEDSEAFKSWKGKKDEERKITMKKRAAATAPGAIEAVINNNTRDRKEAEEEHKAWIKEKNRSLKIKEKERKAKEDKVWESMKQEREALIERKRKELEPHVQKRELLFKMERDKYKSMTSGMGLPKKLASRLEELKKNPLNCDVVMVQVIDVNKKSNSKGKRKKKRPKIRGKAEPKEDEEKKDDAAEDKGEEGGMYGEDFEQPSVGTEGNGYGQDFEDEEEAGEYEDDFDEKVDEPGKVATFKGDQLLKTVTQEKTPSRIRTRTFALGLDSPAGGKTNNKVNDSIVPVDFEEQARSKKLMASGKMTIVALKEKLNHEKSILSLKAGQQYRHRKTIQRANETFGTVRNLRDRLSKDEEEEREQERKRMEQWVKDHPPKHGVKNRPIWDNDFTNPESSDLNARDTKKAVQEARDRSFRGQVGPGYGIDLKATPEGFGMGTNVDGYLLDGIERSLEKIQQPDLLELGSFFSPPVSVQAVIGAVAVLLGIEPDWMGVYKGLLRNSYYFQTCLRFFDKDSVSLHTALVLEQYMDSVLFEEDKCERGSKALGQLRAWVVAVWDYITGEELRRLKVGGKPVEAKSVPSSPQPSPPPKATTAPPPNTPATPAIKVDPTAEPCKFDDTDYEDSSDADKGDYSDDFFQSHASESVVDATKLVQELEELKKKLADAQISNERAEERVKAAEEKAAKALDEEKQSLMAVEEIKEKVRRKAEEKEEEDIKHVREEMKEKEDHDIGVVRIEMERKASEALAKAKEEAQHEIDLANKAAEEANKLVASLKASAKEKSRMGIEMSAMLAKEKLMRKLASKKKVEPMLKNLLESEVDEEDDKENKAMEKKLKKLEEEQRKREAEGKEKDQVIELQKGILKAMKWLGKRDEVVREGKQFGELASHPGVDSVGISELEKLELWFEKVEDVNGSGKGAREGVEGFEKAKRAAAALKSLNESGLKEDLHEVEEFDSRMQESNGQLNDVVNGFYSDLLDEVVRIWGRGKTLGVAEHYVEDGDGEVLESVRVRGGLEGVGGSVGRVREAVSSLGDGLIHLGDVMMKDAGGNGHGEYTEALRCFLISRCFDVKSAHGMMKAGVGYEGVQKVTKAEEIFLRAIDSKSPGVQAECRYHLGVLKVQGGSTEEALELLDSAATLAAKNGSVALVSECHREKGVVFGEQGKWKQAAKSYAISSELNPASPEYLSAWALALKNAGLFNKAAKKFLDAQKHYTEQGNYDFAEHVQLEVDECLKQKRAISPVGGEGKERNEGE